MLLCELDLIPSYPNLHHSFFLLLNVFQSSCSLILIKMSFILNQSYKPVNAVLVILINIIYFTTECPTCSGEPTLVNSERTAASAEDADAKSVLSANTIFCSAGNASERTERSSDSLGLDERDCEHIQMYSK